LRFGTLSDSTAIARRIAAWPRMLVASPDYLAKAGMLKAPPDLPRHTVIARPPGGGPSWSFRKHVRVASVRVAHRLAVTLNEGAIAAPVAGLGIVSTSLWSCRKELTSGTLVQVLPGWDMVKWSCTLCWPRCRALCSRVYRIPRRRVSLSVDR